MQTKLEYFATHQQDWPVAIATNLDVSAMSRSITSTKVEYCTQELHLLNRPASASSTSGRAQAVMPGCHASADTRQRLTIASKLGFSSAAATRSLSASCLFTACSVACAPGATLMSTYMQVDQLHTRKIANPLVAGPTDVCSAAPPSYITSVMITPGSKRWRLVPRNGEATSQEAVQCS